MSVLNKEVYEALLEAGVSSESASRAAESIEQGDLDKRLAIEPFAKPKNPVNLLT